MNRLFFFNILGFSVLSLASCLSHKEMINFSEGTFPTYIANQGAIKLQTDDLLDINVFNSNDLDPNTIIPYNLNKAGITSSNETVTTIYRIDEVGEISFPGIGQLSLAKLTLNEARDTIVNRLKVYLKDPIVNIRMVNFRITVLGEVRNPNNFSVTSHHLNILEALGMAGDLTDYGRRDNILVIRESGSLRSYGSINLKSKDAFNSPFFQLQQNDIIYVEPLKQKTGAVSDQTTKILPWVSIGSVVLNLIIVFAR